MGRSGPVRRIRAALPPCTARWSAGRRARSHTMTASPVGTGGPFDGPGIEEENTLRTDIVVGANFPDYQLEDQSGARGGSPSSRAATRWSSICRAGPTTPRNIAF